MARSRTGFSPTRPLAREWITRTAERAVATLASEGADLKRLRKTGFKAAALDRVVLESHDRHYTTQLAFGHIENQEQSGRCWLFAPLVLVRAGAIRDGRLRPQDSFSENYLYFFNLLEKARAALVNIGRLAARNLPHDSAALREGLSTDVMGLADGGEWEWAFGLISKYGLVPSTKMPETASTRDTRALRVDLHERIARAARAIQDSARSAGQRTSKKGDALAEEALDDVVRILVAHLGAPPDKVRVRGRDHSPVEFATQVIGFDASEWRVLISNPLLAFGRAYELRGSSIDGDSPEFNQRRLNVSLSRLRTIVTAAIEDGHAAGFSAEVERNDIDFGHGIMHPALFDRALIYGRDVVGDLPRREDIYLGTSKSKHAMAIVGFDQPSGSTRPVKFKVVNSWGPDSGDHGVYHMYADWFEENVFKVAVHHNALSKQERAAWVDPEPAPGGQFY